MREQDVDVSTNWDDNELEKREFDGPNKDEDSNSSNDAHEEEELDPRVEMELQKMNAAMDGINFLETELMEGKALYNQMLQEAGGKLKNCQEKLGKCVEKARPYFDALKKAKQSQYILHQAGLDFEEAQQKHHLAKRRVREAEKRVATNCDHLLTQQIQQLLNKTTMEVMATGSQKTDLWKKHQEASSEFTVRQKAVLSLSKSLSKKIKKARPYYDMKMALNKQLEPQKERVEKMGEGIQFAKTQYNTTLRNLEKISENIHRMRKIRERQLRQMQKRAVRMSLGASEDESMLTGYQITGSDIEMAHSLCNFEMEGMYNEPSVYSMSPTSSSLASLSGTDSEISPEDDSREISMEGRTGVNEYEVIDSKDIAMKRATFDLFEEFDSSPRPQGKPISIFMPSLRKWFSMTSLLSNSDDDSESRGGLTKQRSLTDSALSLLRQTSVDRTIDDLIADLTMEEVCESAKVVNDCDDHATVSASSPTAFAGIEINIVDCDNIDPFTQQAATKTYDG